uniref:RUN and TBC1 domain-containing protein 3 n=1 Tax=Setaria digitata TaxID=48799 RepID=A0A915PXL9_9BILA
MARYRKGKDAKYAETVSDEEDQKTINYYGSENYWQKEIDIPVHHSIFNISEEPFSAINTTLLPDSFADTSEIFDEFGFHVDCKVSSTNLLPIETSQNRMRWIALLEFGHDDVKEELTWSKVDVEKLDNEKLMNLIHEVGISHSLRPFLWPRFCGATKKKAESTFSYVEVIKQCDMNKSSVTTQIEKDLSRTLPSNICFWHPDSKGVESLRRVLKSVAYIYPDVGYCQGMGVIAASLLLFCPEETTFWIMAALIEDIFPPNYYSRSFLGLQADERVSHQLIKIHLPELDRLLRNNDVELSLITINWFLTAFASVLSMRVLLRVWDYLFVLGGVTMFRVLISILKIKEDDLIEMKHNENIAVELFNTISQIPASIIDPRHLMELCISFEFSITTEFIATARRRQQAILLASQGLIINTNNDTNLPKQHVRRRKLPGSKSFMHQIFASSKNQDIESDPKTKNVRLTELIVDLRDAVLHICRYFIECDESFERIVNLQVDYSAEDQFNEKEEFLKTRHHKYRRARALLDFRRQDEDELGFRKNDIITVICEKDEHCWVGEVNGLRGWFPAKFVEVVDDRGRDYTIYGDEAVFPEITDKIRRRLACALQMILEHGLRKSGVLNFASHPWLFIEEISRSFVQKHYNAVYSRLILCTTFSLDQDEKVLTPEELLFRAVKLINESHNAVGAQMDVKFRSLIALAVCEQCLHLWFDLLCSCPEQDQIRFKYYHSWSFIRSPVWRQIKCELRLLAQFSFNLSVDYEVADIVKRKKNLNLNDTLKKKTFSNMLPSTIRSSFDQPLKEDVRDMLIKHHLFSWDL